MLATLRRRRSDDPEAGLTLVEMMVTIVIFGIVGTMLSAWFISTTRSAARATARTDDLLSAQQAMDRLARDIRMAIPIDVNTSAIVSGSKSDDLTMYTNVGTEAAPRKVRWYVSGSTLIRSEVKGVKSGSTWSWPTASAINTITQGVVNDNSPAIFRYLDATADNVAGLCTDVPKPTPCATPLTSPGALTDANRLATTAIEVTLRVGTRNASSGGPLPLRTRVYMPNSSLVSSFK